MVRAREVLEKQMEESVNDYQDQWDKRRWYSFWTMHVVMEEQAESSLFNCPDFSGKFPLEGLCSRFSHRYPACLHAELLSKIHTAKS